MNSARMAVKEKKVSIGENGLIVEVLYQKMGARWFAFSLINDEVFVGSIGQDELERKVGPEPESGSRIITSNS